MVNQLALGLLSFFAGQTVSARRANIKVNAASIQSPLPAFSSFFGCDEPNLATYPKGSALLKELGALSSSPTYFRTHNLLTSGDTDKGLLGVPSLKFGSTNAYTEDANGNPIYNWTIVDDIFDTYLGAGVTPYVEVGFMPLALATNPEPYFFTFNGGPAPLGIYTGWSHPPTSYDKWEELVFQWVTHSVERYGQAEVNKWYFEIWNEPNIPYWNGTREEFLMLHDHATNGVRRALPTAYVGGPSLAGGIAGTPEDNWLKTFLDHTLNGTNYATNEAGTPLDFITWHAKGVPSYINTTEPNYIQFNVSTQLQQIDDAFALVAQYPQLKGTPIVLDEYDPDGCAACTSDAYNYRNSLFYPSYTAASFVRALDLAASHSCNLRGLLTWAFEYEQTKILVNGSRLYDGERVLSTQGIDKAVLNIHRMFAMMSGGQRIEASSDAQIPISTVLSDGIRDDPDVGALASIGSDNSTTYVLVWHYHDNELNFTDASVSVSINNLPDSSQSSDGTKTTTKLTHYRIDNEHSNAFPVWLEMGSPQPPSAEQFTQLKQAGKLAMLEKPRDVTVNSNGVVHVNFTLPIRATSLLVLGKE